MPTAYEVDIRPAQAGRTWMDAYPERFAYGCLPMAIANQHGWEIRSPVAFTAVWNGGANRRSLAILEDEDSAGQIISYFGDGIITYNIPVVFRTEPGFDLLIQGPSNDPVHGATPLAGVVEADWLWSRPSVNWKMTQAGTAVRFKKGQPLCHIFPVRRGGLEAFEPEIRNLSDEPALADYMEEWAAHRTRFNQALKDPESPERKQKWPGHYRRGTDVHGKPVAPDSHRRRLRLKPFADLRGKPKTD